MWYKYLIVPFLLITNFNGIYAVVTMDDLKAIRKDEYHLEVSWLTQMEQNNDYFIVQYSKDAAKWEFLTIVDAESMTGLQHTYNVLVELPMVISDPLYIRVQDVNNNGVIGTGLVTYVADTKPSSSITVEIFVNQTQRNIAVKIMSSGLLTGCHLVVTCINGVFLVDSWVNIMPGENTLLFDNLPINSILVAGILDCPDGKTYSKKVVLVN